MVTINSSVGGVEINNTINDITINASTSPFTVNVSISEVASNFIESDTRFTFNGSNGDTYLIYDSTAGKLQLFVGGVKKQQW